MKNFEANHRRYEVRYKKTGDIMGAFSALWAAADNVDNDINLYEIYDTIANKIVAYHYTDEGVLVDDGFKEEPPTLKLFLLTQTTNQEYETFDSAVVVATDEAAAKLIHPNAIDDKYYIGIEWVQLYMPGYDDDGGYSHCSLYCYRESWAHPDNVTAKYIGEAAADLVAGQVVCASHNAG